MYCRLKDSVAVMAEGVSYVLSEVLVIQNFIKIFQYCL